jgi:signal transduction histidine kinase
VSATGGWDRRRHAALATVTAVVGVAVTVAVLALPFLGFAYRAPALHVVLETTNAIIALLVAYLVYGRFRQSGRMQELLLVLALCTVATANLVLTALPSAVALANGTALDQWAGVAIRFIGTLLFASAALVGETPSGRGARGWLVVASLTGAVLAVGVLGTAFGDRLPPIVDPGQDLGDGSTPQLLSHPLVLGAHGVGAVLYAVAATAFTRRAGRRGDELLRWMGAACVLAAAARVHYLLFPSLYSEYVYSGDLLRLGSYLLMLVGAGREIRSYWELRARAAVLEDRRRMARDLHDGLAQELSYIWSRSRWLAEHPGDTVTVDRISGAAGRALDEARRAIATLTRPVDEPLPRVLQRMVEDLGDRYDVKIVTDLDPSVRLRADRGEALLRIVAEAVRNAVRHGGATRIDLTLGGRPLSLTVADDGRGLAADVVSRGRGGGFGITSMRERARGLGAELRITSAPGEGTTVQVVWP